MPLFIRQRAVLRPYMEVGKQGLIGGRPRNAAKAEASVILSEDPGDAEVGRYRRRFRDEQSPRSKKASDQQPITAASKELTVGELTVEGIKSPCAVRCLHLRIFGQDQGHPLRPPPRISRPRGLRRSLEAEDA